MLRRWKRTGIIILIRCAPRMASMQEVQDLRFMSMRMLQAARIAVAQTGHRPEKKQIMTVSAAVQTILRHPAAGMTQTALRHPTAGMTQTALRHPTAGMTQTALRHLTAGMTQTVWQHLTAGMTQTVWQHLTKEMSQTVLRQLTMKMPQTVLTNQAQTMLARQMSGA